MKSLGENGKFILGTKNLKNIVVQVISLILLIMSMIMLSGFMRVRGRIQKLPIKIRREELCLRQVKLELF